MSSDSYEQLIRRITSWAQANEHIQAVIIIGSRARPQESFDFYSDLDLITLILAHRAAKFIGRRERWRGQLMLSQIRQHLLWLIEKHARISTLAGVDTWYDGRFIEQWAAPSVKETLPDIFAKYDPKDMARALRAILSMVDLMASEIAKNNDIPYPTAGQKATFDWLVSVVIPPE